MKRGSADEHLVAVLNDQLYCFEHYIIIEEFNEVFFSIYKTLRKEYLKHESPALLLRI